MNIQNINENYKNIYIYEKSRNMKLCNYGIEICKDTIILCNYDVYYLSQDIEYSVFKDMLEILKDDDISIFEKYLFSYDSIMFSKLLNTCDFLKTTNLINNFIYNFFTDNIINIYNMSNEILLNNDLLYELILENIIKNIYEKVEITGKYISHYSNRGNPHHSNKPIPDWIYYLIKIMLNWMKNLDINSKHKLRSLLNDAIIYVKKKEYYVSSIQLKEVISNDDKICDIIPFNVLYF